MRATRLEAPRRVGAERDPTKGEPKYHDAAAGRREGEREKGSFGTPWKGSDDESNAVDQTLWREREREREKQRATLTRQRSNSRWRCAEKAAGGRVVRGWRVKGRDVLGPVDTAESPES